MSETVAELAKGRTQTAIAVANKVAAELSQELGLPLPVQPRADLEFPEDITELSGEEVGQQLSYWNAMRSHANYLLSLFAHAHGAEAMEAEQRFDVVYAQSTDKHVTDKRHKAGAARSVRARQAAAARLEGEVGIIKSLWQSYQNNYEAVSRELTRRNNDYE